MAVTARELALDCLLAGEKQGAWSDGYLRNTIRKAGLDSRDAGLATRLTFGVLQNQILLDWHLARLSSTPVEKLEPAIRNVLRLGIYQLGFMDKIPPHAAVNEAVSMAKTHSRNPKAAALVNAVLRAFEREQTDGTPEPEELWIRYSHPKWLVEEFSRAVPEGELKALLAANNGQPPTQAQVNPLRTTVEELTKELEGEGIGVTVHPWLPNCLELEGSGNLEGLSAFREGRFYIQDAAAKLSVLAAGLTPGMRVLDVCGAPGGKSFASVIEMKDQGEIISCDLHAHKIKLISSGAKRLGFTSITAMERDGRVFDADWEGAFDLVIVDAPCSGLGVIRKKPDIRYKDPVPLEGLPKIQQGILSNASRYVRPGGVLLYATCTLLPRENEEVVKAFLATNDYFRPETFCLPGPVGRVETGMVTLWPHQHNTDGFFIAKLRKDS